MSRFGFGESGASSLLTVAVMALALAALLLTFSPESDGLVINGSDVIFQCHFATRAGGVGTPNPHHLLFHYLAWALATLRELGEPDILGRIAAHQFVSCLATVLAAWALFRLIARPGRKLIAFCLALLTAFGAGPWLLAAAGENAPPASCALAFLLFGLGRARLDGREVDIAAPTLLFLIALLLRQDSILALPALFVLLPLRRALVVTGVAGFSSLSLYLLAWSTTDRALGFSTWLVKLARSGPWGHLPDSAGLRVAGQQQLAALVGRAGSDLWLQAAVVGALVVLLAWARPRFDGSSGRVLLALAAFVALRVGFGLWWEPANIEVWTPNLQPLLAILGILMVSGSGSRLQRGLLSLLVVIVIAVNARLVIAPLRGQDFHEQIREIDQRVGPEGRYVLMDFNLAAAFRRGSLVGRWLEEPRLVSWVEEALRDPAAPQLRAWIASRHAAGDTPVFVRDRIRGEPFGRDVLRGLQAVLQGELHLDPGGQPWMLVLRP